MHFSLQGLIMHCNAKTGINLWRSVRAISIVKVFSSNSSMAITKATLIRYVITVLLTTRTLLRSKVSSKHLSQMDARTRLDLLHDSIQWRLLLFRIRLCKRNKRDYSYYSFCHKKHTVNDFLAIGRSFHSLAHFISAARCCNNFVRPTKITSQVYTRKIQKQYGDPPSATEILILPDLIVQSHVTRVKIIKAPLRTKFFIYCSQGDFESVVKGAAVRLRAV